MTELLHKIENFNVYMVFPKVVMSPAKIPLFYNNEAKEW